MQHSLDLPLARHGVIVLLLGLLTGFVIGQFHTRSLGNAAHLTGLIGGFGLIALALLWPKLNLGHRAGVAAAWMTAGSMYLNWLGLVVQGALGQGATQTHPASLPLASRAAGLILTVAVVLSLASTLMILFGLRKLRPSAAWDSIPAP